MLTALIDLDQTSQALLALGTVVVMFALFVRETYPTEVRCYIASYCGYLLSQGAVDRELLGVVLRYYRTHQQLTVYLY